MSGRSSAGQDKLVGSSSCQALSREELIEEIRRRIIEWEKRHWVPYPWRVKRSPYYILIAEVLLKRTTRQAVAREFHKFVQRYSDFYSIYNAPIRDIEKALRNLGLYRQRAKQLKELAKAIVEKYNGEVPDTWEDLVSLPGIGPYTAGAVLSFGYGKRAPVLDSNVSRLLTRLTGKQAKKLDVFLKLLWELVPNEDHDYFNYGLIDLGAVICHYRQPYCDKCPLSDICVYRLKSEGKEEEAKCLEVLYDSLEHKVT